MYDWLSPISSSVAAFNFPKDVRMIKKMAKLSDAIISFQENTLHCPSCDGVYLHQGRVEVFNRAEDADEGTHVVDTDTVQADRNLAGNPSNRRQGLKMNFFCETCHADVWLLIYQHKGNTFVRMEYQDSEN
ncbi:MAG: hypothetical protein JXQ79_04865 [Rhodobacteraceae bacterium]|nr:hypothetical protein [Paracoccaceae bacterium]